MASPKREVSSSNKSSNNPTYRYIYVGINDHTVVPIKFDTNKNNTPKNSTYADFIRAQITTKINSTSQLKTYFVRDLQKDFTGKRIFFLKKTDQNAEEGNEKSPQWTLDQYCSIAITTRELEQEEDIADICMLNNSDIEWFEVTDTTPQQLQPQTLAGSAAAAAAIAPPSPTITDEVIFDAVFNISEALNGLNINNDAFNRFTAFLQQLATIPQNSPFYNKRAALAFCHLVTKDFGISESLNETFNKRIRNSQNLLAMSQNKKVVSDPNKGIIKFLQPSFNNDPCQFLLAIFPLVHSHLPIVSPRETTIYAEQAQQCITTFNALPKLNALSPTKDNTTKPLSQVLADINQKLKEIEEEKKLKQATQELWDKLNGAELNPPRPPQNTSTANANKFFRGFLAHAALIMQPGSPATSAITKLHNKYKPQLTLDATVFYYKQNPKALLEFLFQHLQAIKPKSKECKKTFGEVKEALEFFNYLERIDMTSENDAQIDMTSENDAQIDMTPENDAQIDMTPENDALIAQLLLQIAALTSDNQQIRTMAPHLIPTKNGKKVESPKAAFATLTYTDPGIVLYRVEQAMHKHPQKMAILTHCCETIARFTGILNGNNADSNFIQDLLSALEGIGKKLSPSSPPSQNGFSLSSFFFSGNKSPKTNSPQPSSQAGNSIGGGNSSPNPDDAEKKQVGEAIKAILAPIQEKVAVAKQKQQTSGSSTPSSAAARTNGASRKPQTSGSSTPDSANSPQLSSTPVLGPASAAASPLISKTQGNGGIDGEIGPVVPTTEAVVVATPPVGTKPLPQEDAQTLISSYISQGYSSLKVTSNTGKTSEIPLKNTNGELNTNLIGPLIKFLAQPTTVQLEWVKTTPATTLSSSPKTN